MVMMSQQGPQADDVAPRYVPEPVSAFFRHCSGCFADDLQQAFQRQLTCTVSTKRVLTVSDDPCHLSSRVQDVSDAIVVAPAHDSLDVNRLVKNVLVAGL